MFLIFATELKLSCWSTRLEHKFVEFEKPVDFLVHKSQIILFCFFHIHTCHIQVFDTHLKLLKFILRSIFLPVFCGGRGEASGILVGTSVVRICNSLEYGKKKEITEVVVC